VTEIGDSKALESSEAEAKPAEAKPAEVTTVEATGEPAEVKSADGKRAVAEPAEAKVTTVEVKAEPAEEEPATLEAYAVIAGLPGSKAESRHVPRLRDSRTRPPAAPPRIAARKKRWEHKVPRLMRKFYRRQVSNAARPVTDLELKNNLAPRKAATAEAKAATTEAKAAASAAEETSKDMWSFTLCFFVCAIMLLFPVSAVGFPFVSTSVEGIGKEVRQRTRKAAVLPSPSALPHNALTTAERRHILRRRMRSRA
jgi:hypothetical protein